MSTARPARAEFSAGKQPGWRRDCQPAQRSARQGVRPTAAGFSGSGYFFNRQSTEGQLIMGYRSIFHAGIFTGKTIVVTGGGSGIGRCTAHELAALGASVVLVGRKQDKLDCVTAEIHQDGGQCSGFACDIRDEEAVRSTVANIVAQQQQIHGLVNNAGGQFPAPLMAISKKGWDAVINTNLTGGFLMAR